MAGFKHSISKILSQAFCGVFLVAGLGVVLAVLMSGCREDRFTFKFDHNRHKTHTLDCLDCHADTFEFVAKAGHPQCIRCHAIDEKTPSEKCLLCHKTMEQQKPAQIRGADDSKSYSKDYSGSYSGNYSEGYPAGYSGVKVSHGAHSRAQIHCDACHGRVDTMDALSAIRFIAMEGCVACHFPETELPETGDIRSLDCAFCHHQMDSRVAPDDHDTPLWIQDHGSPSVTRPEYCRRCHQESGCKACHLSTMPKFHTIVFRKRGHGTRVSHSPEQCEVCHTQDFCVSCHLSTEPVSHTPIFKSSRPYTHCGMCHLPLSPADRCIVCHKSAPHNEARAEAPSPPPSVPLDQPCFLCHPVDRVPVTHLYNTIPDTECTYCHGR